MRKPSLDQLIATRVEFLVDYQDAAYAAQYRAASSTRCARPRRPLGSERLERGGRALPVQADGVQGRIRGGAAAYRSPLHRRIAEQFEGDYKLVHHLAPPLLGKTNAQGEPVKQAFGPWVRSAFGVLARLKGLRGGPLDIFGRSEERRTERALIDEYRRTIDELLRTLAPKPARARSRSPACRNRSAATAMSRRAIWPWCGRNGMR